MVDELRVFTGNANPRLAEEISDYLGIPLGEILVGQFSDGEIQVKIGENVRGVDVFMVQPTFPPADNLLELLITMDAALRASAGRITAVIPYFGYARQDKKDEPRVPISAKLVSNLIATAGADRVLTLDLHVEQIQGFFDIPVDHLYATPVMIEYFRSKGTEDFVIIAPDPGGVGRARATAKRLGGLPIAFIDKRRPAPNLAEVFNVVGEVKGKKCLVVDDLIDTGGTLVKGAQALKENGADEVYAFCTHPVLSDGAVEKLRESPIQSLVVTNTIPLTEEKKDPKITVLSVARLLGEAISRIHRGESVSSLFV